MDKEFLENYQAKEDEEYQRLVINKIEEGSFDFEIDKYPPDRRFVKLQHPITDSTTIACEAEDRWNQVPFNGSTVIYLPACPPSVFERFYFKISEIPKIIDFIKETGRIQIGLQQPPEVYAGLTYLDPFFKELEPPHIRGISLNAIGTEKELQQGRVLFYTLSEITFTDFYSKIVKEVYGNEHSNKPFIAQKFDQNSYVYAFLRLRYPSIAQEVENALIDNPAKAMCIMDTAANFIIDPLYNLRFDSLTHSFEEIKLGKELIGQTLSPKEIRFPGEVGKFLLNKLTYAPKGLRACNELIDHYNSYDLQKVNASLNNAILENQPDIVEKNLEEFADILDNVWNDKTVPRKISGLKIGIPLSLAAIGEIVAGPLGGVGGLLAGLGFSVGEKILEANMEGLNEKIAKKFSKSYQVNIYDFKKKYKANIVT